jgi:hypothetical protein
MAWLWILTVGFAVVFGQPVGAQESGETVEAHGRWVGELQFKRHGQQDVICKIAVSVRNYQIKDGFDCPQVWWLVPGFSWSIVGKVDASGTLASANIMWGKENYAELTGTLRRASGRFSEQISYGTIRSTAGGNAVLALRPEAGAIRVGKATDDADRKTETAAKSTTATGIYDGTYSGKSLCNSNYSFQTGEFNVEANVSAGRARINTIWQGRDSRGHNNYDRIVDEDGTVRIEWVYGGIIVIHFADDPPAFEFVDQCKFPLQKVATTSDADSFAKTVSIQDGTYSGKQVCTADEGVSQQTEARLTIGGETATLYYHFLSRGGLITYHKTVDINESDTITLPIGGPNNPVVVRLKERPLVAEVINNCTIELVGVAGQSSESGDKIPTKVENGLYHGQSACKSSSGFDYMMSFDIRVQDERAKIIVIAEDIRSAAREERVFDVKLGAGGVKRTNLELGRPHDPIEVSFLTDPPTVVYDICDISMRSTEK